MFRPNLNLSVVENNLAESKWNLATRYFEQAEVLYSQRDENGAFKACQKVLESHPEYFPAKKMMRCIEKGERYMADDQRRRLPNLVTEYSDNSLDDTYEAERVAGSCKAPLKKGVQWPDDTMDLDRHKAKPTLSAISKGGQPKSYAGPSGLQSGAFSGNANKLDRGNRREKCLRELLLEGHFFHKTPIEIYHGVKEILWQEDKGKYVCPVRHCYLTFLKRVHGVEHFLDCHLKSDENGVEVQPYMCKSCRDLRFRNLENLIKHGESMHPGAQWVEPLSIALHHKF